MTLPIAETPSFEIEHRRQDALVDSLAAYKARAWRAIVKNARNPRERAGKALVLIGSDRDGFSPLIWLDGPDRHERAELLAARYNAAPAYATTQTRT